MPISTGTAPQQPATAEPRAVEAGPRPFLKWAGGKQQLLPTLLEVAPPSFARYFEPFAGGAALFFGLAAAGRIREGLLADANAELITTYQVVRDSLDALIERLSELERRYLRADLEGRAALFYRVRGLRPRDPVAVAARFVFLNKTCYNGLYRVNRRGLFNVPHGRHRHPRILDRDLLRAASRALQDVELRRADFEVACAGAGPGDFVYFDPPFHPLSATSNFTQYTQEDFGWADQVRLRACIDALTVRGVHVLLSDSPHPDVTALYAETGYEVLRVPARRAINSRADRRGPIDELLVSNRPLLAAGE